MRTHHEPIQTRTTISIIVRNNSMPDSKTLLDIAASLKAVGLELKPWTDSEGRECAVELTTGTCFAIEGKWRQYEIRYVLPSVTIRNLSEGQAYGRFLKKWVENFLDAKPQNVRGAKVSIALTESFKIMVGE